MTTASVEDLSDREVLRLLYDWYGTWAREKQIPPEGDWSTWLILAGRGWGKTRTGAEWIRKQAKETPGGQFALVAREPADARDVMVEGPAGLLEVCPPWFKADFQPSNRRVIWPNGSKAILYSSYEPDQLRGPEFDAAWCDELASWENPQATWDNLQFGLRQGDARAIVTNTPRPIPTLKEIMDDEGTCVTTGSTWENEANLSESFLRKIREKYEGSRLGRQEIHAEILDDAPGALWSRDLLEETRREDHPTPLKSVVVAVDPATTNTERSDETGMIVAATGPNDHAYVLHDGTMKGSPQQWGSHAVKLYDTWEADRIVYEQNQGGDMVADVIRNSTDNPAVSLKGVSASRGKQARAEPVATLYETGKAHHVGTFPKLEDQLTTWEPGGESPDRLDALVWALTDIKVNTYTAGVWGR